jgi:hypothetical protein
MRLAGDINWTMPTWLKRIVPELREGPVGELQYPPPAAATAVDGGDRVVIEEPTAE